MPRRKRNQVEELTFEPVAKRTRNGQKQQEQTTTPDARPSDEGGTDVPLKHGNDSSNSGNPEESNDDGGASLPDSTGDSGLRGKKTHEVGTQTSASCTAKNRTTGTQTASSHHQRPKTKSTGSQDTPPQRAVSSSRLSASHIGSSRQDSDIVPPKQGSYNPSDISSYPTDTNWYTSQPRDSSLEDPEDYKPGGYLPIRPGATLLYRRYEVVHKLGVGGSAVVWLARDHQLERYVAIKIFRADRTKEDGLREYHRQIKLEQNMLKADLDQYIVPMYNCFRVPGRPGSHLCLVFGLAGPSIASLRDSQLTLQLRPDFVRSLARQMVEALQKIHAAGITWSDLNASNMTLGLINIDAWSVTEVYQYLGPANYTEVEVLPGFAEYVEKYDFDLRLVYPIDFSVKGRWRYVLPQIKCIDFGDSVLTDEAGDEDDDDWRVQARYTDPETHFWSLRPTQASDIWALAAIWFEMRSGEQLFETDARWTKSAQIECAHLATIGPCPHAWYRKLLKKIDAREKDLSDVSKRSPAYNDALYEAMWRTRAQAREIRSLIPGRKIPDILARLLYKMYLRLVNFVRTIRQRLPCPHDVGQWLNDCVPCTCGQDTCGFGSNFSLKNNPPYLADQRALKLHEEDGIEFMPGDGTLRRRIEDIGDSPGEEHSVYESDESDSERPDRGLCPPNLPSRYPLGQQEAQDFEDVLLMMLTWYRRDRASLDEILNMPWLDPEVEYNTDDEEDEDDREREGAQRMADEPWLAPCLRTPRMGNWYGHSSESTETSRRASESDISCTSDREGSDGSDGAQLQSELLGNTLF